MTTDFRKITTENVLRRSNRLKVVRIYARLVTTQMVNEETRGDRTNGGFVNHTMSHNHLVVQEEMTVTCRVLGPSPLPTAWTCLDFRVKTIYNRPLSPS